MYKRLNGNNKVLLRTTSICRTPESILLDFVLKNDRDSIEQIVRIKPDLLEHIYTPEYNKPILLIACSEDTVEPETVKTLIDLGADTHFSSEISERWEALHFAACRTNSRILKIIIDSFKYPGDINAIAKGSNALHILIRYGKSDLAAEFIECAKILISSGIDVNLGDSNYISPILWAAKKGYRDIIKLLIETSPTPIDLDSHQSRRKTARDIILAENLYDGILPEKIENNNNDNDENIIFRLIQAGNELGFLNFKNGEIFDLVNLNDSSSTLLQLCCSKGLAKAVAHLIDKGADPNLNTPKNQQRPIEIAAENGFYDIFKSLVDHQKIYIPKKVLTTLLKYYENEKVPGIDHAKCCDYLLEKLQKHHDLIDVNDQDDSRNSPLHYALRYADISKVEDLLNLGASLGSKNKYGIMPIQDIEPEVLETHLDRCVQFDLKGKKLDKEDFTVTFNYRTIIPPGNKAETIVNYDDPEANFNPTVKQELVTETEVVSYMSQAPEFKHLLQHPVIVSFLFVKWHRIRWLFFANLLFYIAFSLSLVVYIFTSYMNVSNEKLFTGDKVVISLSFIIFILTFIILVVRELFQMAVSPYNYFKNFENFIEIILIFITGSILCISTPSEDTRKQLSSLSILLVAFELILMIGQHPKWSTNVVMLKTVSFNFFKLLIWYSLLIIAFALSFFILFSHSSNAPSNGTETSDDEDFFTDPGKSFFKTIVMTTGEFDAGSMDFSHFPVTSKLIFSLFIFMIVIILLNLLNGLAVSDTQMIKNNAELVGHIARAQHIHYVETMLLGNIFPSKFIDKLSSICCCCPSIRDVNFNLPFAKTACIFPHFLNSYEMTVYPNKYGEIDIPSKRKWSVCKSCSGCCSSIYLDKETVRKTNAIVQARKEEIKAKQEISYIQKIERTLKNFEKTLGDDKLNIYMLNQKLDEILVQLTVEKTE